MCGFYLQVCNADAPIKSKQSNIHLVALAKSRDMKTGHADHIANKIVDELKILETEGITISSGTKLNAVLVNVCSDNLGANSVFGFVESFKATYFCRICELSSAECKVTTQEIPEKIRKKRDYNATLELLHNNDIPDVKQTKGIKKACAFNRLDNFHILDNRTVDLMHDLNEGIIPFFVLHLFNVIIDKKIGTAVLIQELIRDYDYGWFWSKYKPSTVKFKKKNLNQNAMQMHCLILYLPFILIKWKEKLELEWIVMEELLAILRILYSSRIRKTDIDRLRDLVKKHLKYYVDLQISLIPKHHNVTHYATLIELIGPLIHSWMMRYESKHKMFTDFVRLTYNYKNLPFTLATRHQIHVCVNKNRAFKISVQPSKTSYNMSKCPDFELFKVLLPEEGNSIQTHALRFLHIGSQEYRPGLMLFKDKNVFEIVHVMCNNSKYFVLCQKYNILHFVSHFNSIEIEKGESFELIDILNIKSHKTYDKIFLDGNMFIIAETLEIFETI